MWAQRATGESISQIETLVRGYFEESTREPGSPDAVLEGERLEIGAFRAGLAIARVIYQQALARDRGHRGTRVTYRTAQGEVVELPKAE